MYMKISFVIPCYKSEKTIENGWSVDVLAHQINTNLYLRQLETK